jgi:hypothetical protein
MKRNIIAYVLSLTKLEKRAEQVLPRRGAWREVAGEGVGGQGGEMAQTMYAHMNK